MLKGDVILFSPAEVEGAEKRFEQSAKVNLKQLKEIQKEVVNNTKEIVYERTYIEGLYDFIDVDSIDGNKIYLSNGAFIESGILSNVLAPSKKICLQVVALKNFDQLLLGDDNILWRYYLDAWGSALISEASRKASYIIKENVEKESLFITSLWSPGQHDLSLENQRVIFDILNPDEKGITLSEKMIMTPSKSASGFMGVNEMEDKRDLFPCKFCEHRYSCTNPDAVRFRETM